MTPRVGQHEAEDMTDSDDNTDEDEVTFHISVVC